MLLAVSLASAFFLPCAFATTTIVISRTADFIRPDEIADNIKNESKLPEAQSQYLQEALVAKRYNVELSDATEVPKSGIYVKVGITAAISEGNAFIGHRKMVGVLAILYINGVEVAKTTKTRDSMGGAFAGFKGSSAVLHRCCNTLGKDLAIWVDQELPTEAIQKK